MVMITESLCFKNIYEVKVNEPIYCMFSIQFLYLSLSML